MSPSTASFDVAASHFRDFFSELDASVEPSEIALHRAALEYLEPGKEARTLSCALAVDGCFELARRADAIDLLERMLPDAGLTPARYHAILARYPACVAPSLVALHAAASPRPGP